MEIKLVKPTLVHKPTAQAYQAAYNQRGLQLHGVSFNNFDCFEDWLAFSQEPAGSPTPWGFPKVADATYFALAPTGSMVGVINFRHELNDFLRKRGGHIGYSVHPDYWGQGIASAMLKTVLAQAQDQGLREVLITCNADNPASARVIEKNGGVLENVIEHEGKEVKRYWVKLSRDSNSK
ncbi:GNAT family acetyltransferase [Pasteurellaceae bacterium RH1A]|nr:GNAT family acetyltransferase [Pasteurellaceae bacterium RH1A]